MKNIKLSGFLLSLLCICFYSCDDMDDPYKEFIEDGPIIYMGKLESDSIEIAPGRHRIQFSWPPHYDSRVKYAEIFWSNNTRSEKIPMTWGEPTQHIIEDLAESSYIFELFFLDNEGHSSVSTLLQGDSYGSIYEDVLFNCKMDSINIEEEDLILFFKKISDETAKGVNVFWDENGSRKEKQILYPDSTVRIENYKSQTISYHALYKPKNNAIDYFYSDTAIYNPDHKMPFVREYVTCENPHIYGKIDYLFDGIEDNPDNYFSTFPNNRAGYIPLPHNIDFRMMYTIRNFTMRYVLRKNTTDWYPTEIELLVSSDGITYYPVQTLTNLPTGNNASYTTNVINCDRDVNFIRVSTKSVNGSLGAVQFAEIEFYPK